MCGIVGIFGHTHDCDLMRVAEDMTASLVHRGPDDDGVWVDDEARIAFGHRRLSVLDLSKEGHQPMLSKDSRYVMVFNGEVYNHQALRKELEGGGLINWRGHSDTEVKIGRAHV